MTGHDPRHEESLAEMVLDDGGDGRGGDEAAVRQLAACDTCRGHAMRMAEKLATVGGKGGEAALARLEHLMDRAMVAVAEADARGGSTQRAHEAGGGVETGARRRE